MITRALAILALIGVSVGLGGELTGNVLLARLGEAAFFGFGFTAWILAMCKIWKRRRNQLAAKSTTKARR